MSELENEIKFVLYGVDPKYHDTITNALMDLANWHGDKAYREVDSWFTIVYGTILDLEQVLACTREHVSTPLDFDAFDISAIDRNDING